MVSGLDVNFGLEPDDANLSLELLAGDSSPLERSYKPRILRSAAGPTESHVYL
jgi:hypothetical protein